MRGTERSVSGVLHYNRTTDQLELFRTSDTLLPSLGLRHHVSPFWIGNINMPDALPALTCTNQYNNVGSRIYDGFPPTGILSLTVEAGSRAQFTRQMPERAGQQSSFVTTIVLPSLLNFISASERLPESR